jgi:hypothetical protein
MNLEVLVTAQFVPQASIHALKSTLDILEKNVDRRREKTDTVTLLFTFAYTRHSQD